MKSSNCNKNAKKGLAKAKIYIIIINVKRARKLEASTF